MEIIRKRTGKKESLLRALILLAVIVVLNIISIRIFWRMDLTANKMFSLSDASIGLIDKIDDRITIKAYVTEDLPAKYNDYRRYLIDLLNEYKAYGGNNIYFEFINPEGEEGELEARQQGILPFEIEMYEEDKVELRRAYMGMVVLYEDQKEVLPILTNLTSLEYELSSAIKRLTAEEKKTIAYTTGHQETDLGQLRVAGQAIGKFYHVKPVDFSTEQAVPNDATALLIIDPKAPFSDTAKKAIDDFVMRGGKLGIFASKIAIDLSSENPQAKFNDFGLDGLLSSYGVFINPDIAIDAQCATIMVARQQGAFQVSNQVKFPLIPEISNFNEKHVVVEGFRKLIMPFTSTLDTSIASSRNIKCEVLASTSEKSGRQSGQIRVNPFYQWTQSDFPSKHLPVAAVYSGEFVSAFAVNPQSAPKSPNSQIVVVGTGQFLTDQMAQQSSENKSFFSNIVDYLADDTGLSEIRAKNVSMPVLEETSEGTKTSIKYLNIILPPLAFILFGLYRWRRRVSFKKSFEEQI